MLLNKEQSCLILVDVQEKLAPKIHQSEAMLSRCQSMLELAEALSIPILACEQYPKGLGETVKSLRSYIKPQPPIPKTQFSCWRDAHFQKALQVLGKKQVVVIGIETHVCVLQTSLDLLQAGYEVFVVVDAVGTRHPLENKYGLKRLRQAKAELLTGEMVFFEWIGESGTPLFKSLSKQFFSKELL